MINGTCWAMKKSNRNSIIESGGGGSREFFFYFAKCVGSWDRQKSAFSKIAEEKKADTQKYKCRLTNKSTAKFFYFQLMVRFISVSTYACKMPRR